MKTALLFFAFIGAGTAFAENNLPFAIPFPQIVYCKQEGAVQRGPNTVVFGAQDCGGNFLPDLNYVGAISIMQVNGGENSYRVAMPNERAGVWFFTVNPPAAARYSIAVVYTRLR